MGSVGGWVLLAVLQQPMATLQDDGSLGRDMSVKATMVVPDLTREACDNAGKALDAMGVVGNYRLLWTCAPMRGVAKLEVEKAPKK